MSNIIKVSGIVLSAYPMGENDKNLTVLTKERGKIHLISRGCKRPNSPLFAASNEYVYGEFVVAEGRTMNYLNSAEIHKTFANLRESLEDIYYGTYFCELASYFTMEGQDERNILNLLYLTFTAMGKRLVPYSLIRRIFEFKILQFHGIGLQSFRCVHCGREEDLHYLSLEGGGVVCDQCKSLAGNRTIEPQVLYVLQFLSACALNEIYSFRLTEELMIEFEWIVNRFFKTQVDHRFKSEAMLEIL